MKSQLHVVSEKLNIPPENLQEYLSNFDNKYHRWVLKQLKFKNVKFPEDIYRVKQTLQNFQKYNKNLKNKDILKYRKISDLDKALETVIGTGSKRKGEYTFKPENLPGVEPISEYDGFKLYKVSDPESLMDMGIGTHWCTRRDYEDCAANDYIDEYGYIYVVVSGNKPYAQITPDFDQVLDVYNDDVGDSIPRELFRPFIPDCIDFFLRSYNDRWVEIEPYILKDPRCACEYAINIIMGRWPEAEPYIMKDPMWAYYYAMNITKDRWPEAEPYIIKDPEYAYCYAKNAIKGRWVEAEPYIMKDPMWSYWYAKNVIKGRWDNAEPYIMKDPEYAYYYAMDVIKGRWVEAESYIMKNPRWAYWYAKHAIGGRWVEAEPYILENPKFAYKYMSDILKIDGRMIEIEHIIMKDPAIAIEYIFNNLGGTRWPDAEPYILDNLHMAYIYVVKVLNGERWPEAESYMMKSPQYAYYYARDILKGRWPEAEQYIMRDRYFYNKYKELIGDMGWS